MEIESLAELQAWLDAGRSLHGVRLQNLDLTACEARLLTADPRGLVVLGGRVSDRLEAHLRSGGALVFPPVTGVPVDPYRSGLYTPDELYQGLDDGYAATPDARAYRWWLDLALRDDILSTMLRAVHDDSVSDALHEALHGRRTVGVMGGHAIQRGQPTYLAAARLGARLASDGTLVLTGGGPGAMEAAALGAALHDRSAAQVEGAVAELAAVASFADVTAWARAGFALRARLGLPSRPATSLGVPTWFYGHEPSNVFSSLVAKFFSNAQREDLLLSRSTGGLVVLPGAAGTVQEIFQTATRSYYGALGEIAPIVLVGRDYWTTTLPAWPLLTALAAGRDMAAQVHLVDDVDAAAELLAFS
jgi:predicted Rossmann-fold nucleotide-binding protein